jgi:hypothetical protein
MLSAWLIKTGIKTILNFLFGVVKQKDNRRIALLPLVNFNPYVPHLQALQHMVNSEILLLVIHESAGNKGMLTGKLFEYARSYNYILALGPGDGEAAQFLKETSSGRIFDYQDDLTGIIRQRYELWLKKEPFKSNIEEIKKYSRKNLTGDLVNVFNNVLQVTN